MVEFEATCQLPHQADTCIQLQELCEATPNRNIAPGADNIPYSLLRHAGPEMEGELLDLYNRSYTTGVILVTWKTAIIAAIPKAGDRSQFYPISLLSCLGKMMERFLLSRLEWEMGPPHCHLYTFHWGTGTIGTVSTLIFCVLGRQAVAIFLDLEKAFETASAAAIIFILA